MPSATNYRAFPHIQTVLDEAVQRGGLRYTLSSDKEAWRWRSLAYHFRKLYQKEQQKLAAIMATVPTSYDAMFIQLEGATCVIQFHESVVPLGTISTLDGLPINELTKRFEPEIVPDNADLVDIAESLKNKLLE